MNFLSIKMFLSARRALSLRLTYKVYIYIFLGGSSRIPALFHSKTLL